VAMRLMVFGIDFGNGKWYASKQLLDLPPHKASPLQPNRTLVEYVDVYSPLLYTPNTPILRLSALQPLLRRG
jgi:hypothetical protein